MKTKDAYTETMIKLTELEAKLDVLLVMFAEIKDEIKPKEYVNPVHSSKDLFRNASTGCLVCGKYDCTAQNNGLPCPSMTPYALATGNFVDAGFCQVWRESIDENQDSEE
jgi:hypothetical protein